MTCGVRGDRRAAPGDPVHGHAAALQLGTHGAVEDNHLTAPQALDKFLHRLSSPSAV
jgi:hypothetical protein